MHHETDSAAVGRAVCACTALRKASRAITRVYDDALAAHGMTTTQFAILRHLDRANGELPLSRLAERLVMDRTSLYRTIEPVRRAGWVDLTDGSGRAKLARLTDAGRAAMATAEPDWARVQHRVEDLIGAESWRAMTATLEQLQQVAA